MFADLHLGSILVTVVSLIILISWDKIPGLKNLKLLPAALVAVAVGIFMNWIFIKTNSGLAISE